MPLRTGHAPFNSQGTPVRHPLVTGPHRGPDVKDWKLRGPERLQQPRHFRAKRIMMGLQTLSRKVIVLSVNHQ